MFIILFIQYSFILCLKIIVLSALYKFVTYLNVLYSTQVGLQESNENNFRVGLKAHQDGIVTVHVEVTLPRESTVTFFGNQQVLSSDVQIQVHIQIRFKLSFNFRCFEKCINTMYCVLIY